MEKIVNYELTNPQKSIWNMEEFFKGTTINNICAPDIIYERIDENVLKQALNNIVKKNDSFRIQITLENGIPMQHIEDYKPFDIDVIHIKDESEIKKLEEEGINYKFNIINSSLYHFKIFILENGFGGFVLTVNHLIADSWSMGLVARNAIEEYHAILRNEDLPENNNSYIDYINSEKEYKESKKYEVDKEYWEKTFETIPEQATIPGSIKKYNNFSCRGSREIFWLDTEIVQKMKNFCTNNKISVFNFLMSVYGSYLSRVSNLDDFVIGTPILNRGNYKEKQTMGMFINTVPVRINMQSEESFADFSRSIGRNLMSVFKHQKYSYNQILEDLRSENANIPNLYNVMISYQITKAASKEYGDYKTDWIFNGYCADDLDIHITDLNDTGELKVNYDYLIDNYSAEDIQNLHKRILYMMNQVFNNEIMLIKDIEIVTEEEKNKILNEFNNTKVDYPKDKTVVQLFEEQVEKTPDNISVVFEEQKLTYRELNEKANSLARYLKEYGVKEKDVVSIFLDKSLESIIAILATLKCGCAYMPIDINYPSERIRYMINNSSSKNILTTENQREKLSSYSNVHCIELQKEIYNKHAENNVVQSIPDDLAYIMYTSGSTGEPKGVMVQNKNIVRLVKNTNFIEFKEKERILQTGSIVFDACTFEIWGALLNGFELYVIKKEELLDPILFEKYLRENKITILWLTAPLFNQLSENNPKMFETVRILLTGGDVLSPKHINAVKKECKDITIINGYGPTENTTFSTCFTINKNYEESIPIGYPIANSTCYVVSKDLMLMPINVPGELLVGGDGVSKGYLKNEEQTNLKFIPNKYGEGILYKTGDLVKWNEDGSIEFIGRIDNQVKIRGFRVELGEITLKIQEFEGIKECFTTVKKLKNNEKVICTYFSAKRKIEINKLKEFLNKSLPNYAIPTYFMQLNSLPINANGKVDKNRLEEPQYENTRKEKILPRNDIDKKLIEILKELLNNNSISLTDSFFDLGGDSLSAINLCAKIKSEFKTEIFVKDILNGASIQDIADKIIANEDIKENVLISQVKKNENYPVSSAQKRMYYTSQIAGTDSILYNIPGGVIFEKKVDAKKLEDCLNILINRHESLRTYFEIVDRNLVQKIIDNCVFKLDILNDCNYEEIDSIFEEFVKPFDLRFAPLFRAKYITFTNGKSVLFIDMHHIISDGASMSIFTDELCKLYNGEALPELKITYKDYAAFENNEIASGELKEAEEYWMKQFEGEIPVLDMPKSFQRPAVQDFEGKRIYALLENETSEKIEKISQALGITPYMFLLSAYYILLSKYTSNEDIIVGSPVVGRDIEETYNLIGMFVNTLALRQKIDSNISFKEFVLQVKENLLNSYKYQTYPFDELVNKLNIKRDTSRNPLFDVMFIYQNNGFKEIELDGVKTKYYVPDTNISKFDLSIEAVPDKEGIHLSFEYATKLFKEEFIENLSKHYINIINEVLKDSSTKISEINMLSEEENRIYESNITNKQEKQKNELKIENTKRDTSVLADEINIKLIKIVKDILDIDNISITDSFFDLGGDSLSAINLYTEIKNTFNAEISVRNILENPTIEGLSNMISKNMNTMQKQEILKIPEAEYYLVSSAQKRMYYTSQVAGESSILYNIPEGIVFDGIIDDRKIEKSIQELIKRHETLRTYFETMNDTVVQKIAENVEFKLDVIQNVKFENIHDLFLEFVKPFDLRFAPLFRAKYITFTNGKSVLFIDIHHIVFDGKSVSIFADELCKLYNGETLPELKITYKDYAAFENNQIVSGELKEAEEYWMKQFEGEIPVLDMPKSFQRPAVQDFEGKRIYALLENETSEKIEKISQALGITPYMFLLSAYYILLSKYTSNEDIIVGSPVVGRDIEETYNLIGMFVNTLALRQKIDSNISFKEFVLQVKENLLNSYKYQTYPFDELVNKLNIKRDTSRNPLFDVMFIYQNNGFKEIELDGVKTKYYVPDTNISKFDLSIEAVPDKEGIHLSFEYATKLFKEEFIENLSKHYINIINEVLKDSSTKISEINMLSEEEKNKILHEFNNTEVNYPKDKTVVQLFEEQVEKTPDNVAVVFEDQEITYRELNERANSLAHLLREKEISRNDLVGIMVNRSIEMIIAILAVLKAGGAYIPIDPTYPQDRVEYMLNSSNAKILLTQNKLKDKVNFENKIFIELNNESVYSYPVQNMENVNEPDDLFYVIFTSGSTGRPKGVMIMHKTVSNFTNYCNNYVEYLKNPSYQTILSITTISFDIFVYETIISLQRGLKVVIANENEQTTPKLLNELIEKHNITITQSTPSVMQVFVNNIEEMPLLKNLKYITLAGEQLPLELVNKLHKIANGKVYNGYGPSETYYVTLTEMNDEIITIGKPIDNTQIYILDKDLKPVPIGSTGELYMSGDCIAKGYLNNEELTSKSFIQNPFVPGTIMYKSGDLGKYTEDGNILCLGRIDHQIKIRGQRIELGEIESLISRYPNIKNVTVVKQTIQNRECISAYYIADKRITGNDLRKYLSRMLPRYMIPSYFIALEEFPYTPNGKVDKKVLPLPKEIMNVSEEEYVAPKTELQRKLVNIWEKVLNTKPIGINDNFFELGGDSILAMNLNVELLKITNRMNYSDIFRFPTIAEQEEKINSSVDTLMFSKIENLSDNYVHVLKNNKNKDKIKTWHPRNILLTGGTGFLGVHILEEFIKNEIGNVYCIVREEPGLTAKAKLHQKLNYYFGNKYDDLIGKRIFAVIGNITKPGFGLNQDELLELANSIDVVINSAARVAHYGNYDDFYNANVKSVRYIIDFCSSFNKKLYHISTTGVSGVNLDLSYLSYGKNKNAVIFDESSLYVGQLLDNVYTRSKFEAESYVLNAIARGVDGYILRMGNLMPRFRDGVFQENVLDNAFINKLASFAKIGVIPDYLVKSPLEFTPVDYAAKAVCKLITHPSYRNRVFHLYNYKTISTGKFLKLLKKANYNVEILNENKFKERVNKIIQDDNSNNLLNNLLNDFNRDLHLDYNNDIIIMSNFTIKYLRKMHFKWPKISNKYLIRFINLLKRVI